MKQSTSLFRIVLICSLGLLFSTCQKEAPLSGDQTAAGTDANIAINSSLSNSVGISGDLSNLIVNIKTMVKNGMLSNKDGKSLISNLDGALKSIKKGMTGDASGYLNAFIIETERLINAGTITIEEGQAVSNVARYAAKSITGAPLITEGLIAFYPFNGNTNDAAGNGRNGVSSNITFSDDRNSEVNSAVVFSGDGSVRVPGIGQTNGSFSIALWYKTGQSGSILATDNIFFGADNIYNQFIVSWNISIGTYAAAGNPVYFDDTWHHVVITHDSNAGRIITYFDGVVRHDRPESGYFLGNNEDIYLGIVIKEYDVRYPYINPNFIGSIDDIYFFNRAINASEVGQLYYYPH
jgi:hypothetical protein